MIPGAFDYHRPTNVNEAALMLRQFGEDARPLAGGHSLIPMMKLRLATPEHLVDLAGVAELKGVRARRRRHRHRRDDHAARPHR